MKPLQLAIIAACLGTTTAIAQQAGSEPINSLGELPLGGFPGCTLEPPKDNCDARIACRGVGTLYGDTGLDLQDASTEAYMDAKQKLAEFYQSKQKGEDSIRKASAASAKSTADGGKSVQTSSTRLIQSMQSTSAEAVLSGVQTLGRAVDAKQRTVTMKIGVSCKSQAAAATSRQGAMRSGQSGSTPSASGEDRSAIPTPSQGAESFKIAPGNLQNMKQTTKQDDDF